MSDTDGDAAGETELYEEILWACGQERPHLEASDWVRGGFGPVAVVADDIPEADGLDEVDGGSDGVIEGEDGLEALPRAPEVRFEASPPWEGLKASLSAEVEPQYRAERLDARAPGWVEAFRARFEGPGIPCVIDHTEAPGWSFLDLLDRFETKEWRLSDTHGETLRMDRYARYVSVQEGLSEPFAAETTAEDEDVSDAEYELGWQQREWQHVADCLRIPCHDAPLALYDSTFGEWSNLASEYAAPACFSEDLFRHLRARPPFRWILAGPQRSGTGMHVDPLLTDAWLTLTAGLKRWVLFPPDTPVDALGCGAAGEPQLEAVHWYAMNAARPDLPRRVEVLQRPGECVFIPSGWHHCVLNLELSVAVTHNYCPEPRDGAQAGRLEGVLECVERDEAEMAPELRRVIEARLGGDSAELKGVEVGKGRESDRSDT